MTLEDRTDKKLLEKINWYKEDGKRKRENEESKFVYHPPLAKRRRGARAKTKVTVASSNTINTTTQGKNNNKIKALMFIPYTRHSELAHSNGRLQA